MRLLPLLICLLPITATAQTPPSPPAAAAPTLFFEPTPTDSPAFVARGGGVRMVADATGLRLVLPDAAATMRLAGGARATLVAEQPTSAVSNYYVGGDPTQWRRGVRRYQRVRAQDVMPGVDVVYYGSGRQLEFDLELAPGAEPEELRLEWQGARDLRVDAQGRLHMRVGTEALHLEAPKVFERHDERTLVPCRYRLHEDGTVGFAVERRTPNSTLVIDPILVFATLLGGSGAETVAAVDVYDDGSTVVIGSTNSTDFPLVNPMQSTLVSRGTTFVTRYDPAGNVVFSTYLGDATLPVGVRFDSFGSVYVAGTTGPGFPATQGIAQPVLAGFNDFFVAEISASGSLLWGSYLGGLGDDRLMDLEVGPTDEVFLLGQSTGGFPVDPFAYNTRADGVVLAKLDRFGMYDTATNIGIDSQYCQIALDIFGTVFIAGATTDSGLPTTPLALAPSPTSGGGFVLVLQSTLDVLIWATYFPGSISDVLIHRDRTLAASYATVIGSSSVGVLPATGSLNPTLRTSSPYVAQLSGLGRSLRFAVWLPDLQNKLDLDEDAAGNLYVLGRSTSPAPPLKNAFYRDSTDNLWLAKLDPQATSILYATQVGGRERFAPPFGFIINQDLVVTPVGEAIVAGTTGATYFETTPGAPQPAPTNFASEAFIARFSADSFEEYGQITTTPGTFSGAGDLRPGGVVKLRLRDAQGGDPGVLLIGAGRAQLPLPAPVFLGGATLLVANPIAFPFTTMTGGVRYGFFNLDLPLPRSTGISGATLNTQVILVQFGSVFTTNGLEFTIQ